MINLRIIKNPFKPYGDSVLKQVAHVPGAPVLHYVQQELLAPEEVEVILNSRVLEPEEFNTVIPEPDDYMAILPQVAGGGGRGSKNVLAVVASIGLMFLTMGVGNLIEGALSGATGIANWGFWAFAGAMGTQYIGGQLLSSMFPPPKTDEIPSATYGWNGIQPLVGQNQPAPVILGTMRTAGQVVAQHVSSDGDKQYLNLLIEAGEGPCDYEGNGEYNQGDSVDRVPGIAKIQISGNPVENYAGIAIYKRAGLNEQSAIPNFNDVYNDQELNVELTDNGDWSAAQTTSQTDAEMLELTFSWPMGLYDVNPNSGGFGDNWVDVTIQYKPSGNPDWTTWGTKRVAANTRQALYQSVRIDLPVKGQYDVRCRKSGVLYNQTNEGDVTKTYWTQLSTVAPLDLCRPNKILIGIKALATNQLSGGRPVVTFELSRSKVWVYNPDLQQYEQQPANNPAWAAYWMLHRVYKLQNMNTGQPEFRVRGIPADKLVYEEFQKWAEFCASPERKLGVNLYFDSVQKLRDALHYVEELGRGRVIPRGTKYGCIFDALAQRDRDGGIVAAQLFNMSNIELDSFSEQFVDVSDRATAIEVTYFDAKNQYERTTILVPADGLDDAAALVNPTQITLTGCTDRDQAWREGKYRLRLNDLCCTASWTAEVDAIVSSLGQVVLVQHDVPAWGVGGRIAAATANSVTIDNPVELESGKTYQMMIRFADDTLVTKTVSGVDPAGMVLTVSLPFDAVPEAGDIYSFGEVNKVAKPFKLVDIKRSGDLKYTLTGLEYKEAVYSEAGNAPEIEYSYLEPIFEAVNVTAVEETFRQKDGTMISRLRCNWQCPRGKRADQYIVDYSTDGGASWTVAGTTIRETYHLENARTGVSYQVKIRVVSGALISKGTLSSPVMVTGKDAPPSNVASITAVQDEYNRSRVILSWPAVDPDLNPDLRDYLARVGESWETGADVAWVSGLETNYPVKASGNYTFFVKARDNSGNYSQQAAATTVYVDVKPNCPAAGSSSFDPLDRSRVILTWEPIADKDLETYEVYLGKTPEDGVKLGETKETTFRAKLAASGTANFIIRARNSSGFVSNTLNIPVVASVEAPDVTGFMVKQLESDRDKIRFSWERPDAVDVVYYEIRAGASWDAGEVIGTGITGLFYDTVIKDETLKYYWIKAMSTGGFYSQYPAMTEGIFRLNPATPTGLTITQDVNDRSSLIISWAGIADLDLNRYILKVGDTWDSAVEIIKTRELKTTWHPAVSGDYKFMLKALNNAGFFSDEVATHFYAVLEPDAVTGFRAFQNGANALLTWEPNDESDVVGYEIREGNQFENGTLVASGLTNTTYQAPVDTERAYKFLIKAVNRAGKYSRAVTPALVVIANLPPKNVIEAFDELNLRSGAHCNTAFGGSSMNFANLGGRFIDYPQTRFGELGGIAVLKLGISNWK